MVGAVHHSSRGRRTTIFRRLRSHTTRNAGARFADRGNDYFAGEGSELLGKIQRRLRGLGDVAGEIDEKRGHGIGIERVGEDDGTEALRDGDKDCRADDEALDLDYSWLMRENEDSNGVRDYGGLRHY
ncbi:hypothetical protein LR48_Vigan10g085500 [Vigna angularis]|uniref:Uncharacterized protein n=1 Tax=Phaseolus angularis TaxID=3914 RepID=A0A0L9VJ23_PHAAN|nr:hypothetical protein LR48_Vigan10g085500 [Vigna angularis]